MKEICLQKMKDTNMYKAAQLNKQVYKDIKYEENERTHKEITDFM